MVCVHCARCGGRPILWSYLPAGIQICILSTPYHQGRVQEDPGTSIHACHRTHCSKPVLCGSSNLAHSHCENPGTIIQCCSLQGHTWFLHACSRCTDSIANHGAPSDSSVPLQLKMQARLTQTNDLHVWIEDSVAICATTIFAALSWGKRSLNCKCTTS
jgi:hypothetical protein